MDINTKKLSLTNVNVLDYWKQIPIDDISALMLYQKIENSINDFLEIINNIDFADDTLLKQYYAYVWSVSIRDFTVLLRDSLLAVAKHEQFEKDEKSVSPTFLIELQSLLKQASNEIDSVSEDYNLYKAKLAEWQYQKSPALEVDSQLKELQKQCKKIYRSISKVDDVRTNIGEYIRDFQLQYSIQTSAIGNLFSIVEEVSNLTKNVSKDDHHTIINNIVDQIGDKIQELELIQSTESIDIFPYQNKETLILPISTSIGKLNYKSINVKSEFARWFSSFIYPKIIELERKRDHAAEKCLMTFRQVQTKIAAISLAELNTSTEIQKEFETNFKQLDKDVLDALKIEEAENNTLVTDHLLNYLKASNVYLENVLFLPESRSSQISNISKDAQKRIVTNLGLYKNELKSYVNKILSRYIEVDQTSYSQFIKNKLSINNEDDSLALFLKNGYLGKSFTVSRPEIINSITDDYNLWNEGFAGAILLSGVTGSGKSTILGMLNHLGLNEEIIQLKMGESYFIQHRSYEPLTDLNELIDNVIRRSLGRRVIICIDDLEQWHDNEYGLFDKISNLFSNMAKHRNRIFFVVTCSTFLKERLNIFKDLKPVFSSQISLGQMHSNQIKAALNLRARVNELDFGKETQMESKLKNIVRECKGNPGFAMLEHCRLYNENYKSNVKSQEFTELVETHQTLLTYITSNHHCSIKFLSDSLSEIDFRDTKQSIDHLVSQKILTKLKNGYISINPFLIHTIERILLKE